MRDHRGEYNEMDLIWTHPCGSKLYLGNITAAKNVAGLQLHQITNVVNCMARNTEHIIDEERFSYLRFPIETWEGEMVRRGGDPGRSFDGEFRALIYFANLFTWLDRALANPGTAVLIHCYAGAHRGAAVCMAYLMHAAQLRLPEALAIVKASRPIVDPKELLMELLERLDKEMCERGDM